MAQRIEVALKEGVRDARGERVRREIEHFLHLPVHEVRTIDVYTVDAGLSPDELEKAASEPFSDPVIQTWSLDRPLADGFDYLVEVGFRPGVTDNVGRTAREAIEYITGRPFAAGEGVYTSVQYLLSGALSRTDVERIARDLLCNTLIQRYIILDRAEFAAAGGVAVVVPKVTGETRAQVREIDLNVSDDELMRISREGVLALTLDEMKVIQAHYRNPAVIAERSKVGLAAKPTDAELEAIAQTWSEHCKHKIFSGTIEYIDENGNREEIRSLFKTFIQGTTKTVREQLGERDFCLSVFKDNAGVIRWNDDWSLVFKVETHNSPSALDPYGGALTGIVGVNRDPFGTGKGSKLIFNTDVFCFASPFYDKPLPSRLLHPRRIYEGVVEGVEHGGNKSGIPTVNGSIVFDDRFAGKPLVFCGTAGLMPATINGAPAHEKFIRPGDLIVMTGGRIGKDGIHGATFSSEELHEGSPVTAVQIGDPITQKRMTDFLIRARDKGLYNFITDNGAGGLSSSIGEMSGECGGCRMDLSKAPLKYPGLDPWEILISEAQERMSLAVPPEHIDEFIAMARRFGVEATILGEFTDSGYFHIMYGDRTIAYLPMDFLHGGLPPMQMRGVWEVKRHEEPALEVKQDYAADLKQLLGSLNICSKESVVRRYDHEVQGGSVVKPFTGVANDGPSDAAVIRPVLDSFEGVVVSHGICPRYSDIDAYHMTANAIDEALRNYVAVGGSLDLVAGLDNFCWCDPVQSDKTPDGEYKMAQLVRSNKALYDYCVAFGIPLISGKDSMKNDFWDGNVKISIPPTLLFSVIGKIDDIRTAVTMDAKRPGDIVYLLGKTGYELGGSEYMALKGLVGNSVPQVNTAKALPRYRALHRAISQGLVASCHDLSDGGLAVALAETAFAGGFGIVAELSRVLWSGDEALKGDAALLFSESASRHLVTVRPENREAFESVMAANCFSSIGVVTEEGRVTVTGLSGTRVIDAGIDELKQAWQSPLREL
ncbi:phosphoribosylformylglycinamidine synthase subunit PurS [Geobacter sulfurreducens]|uniref:Phosphoribosylformylglycinamidine synthase subunit PurL n=1 Tax=Geobacter sulfurreducens (strain ATCC 51573 / DSM 12127 / PCA) TaxID=243231 RepID=Q74CN9_GEOSL|nr:phosphoribosylformylglycinamidine synthase subunit PurS [Geobacter sulfurreducens]AAR35008.1 phosphoribosylformylglycinamidine synthase, PurS and PurL domains [Geobacter sulfurreducens PCA]ADI84469.1 phosphoribosylformylglycinamidine synthase, PurS and PurL domains [Geobacter sulfurreducens KN400]AJY71485.1 phosphoribosylformylglycinamidine synthase [Geobacter sulfurreducens]UAC05634.1 phosphoribosylformylglycinamidine synthase subunit PurS [Geobacter sulfurreducens]UTG94268.1 phosphoribosy